MPGGNPAVQLVTAFNFTYRIRLKIFFRRKNSESLSTLSLFNFSSRTSGAIDEPEFSIRMGHIIV